MPITKPRVGTPHMANTGALNALVVDKIDPRIVGALRKEGVRVTYDPDDTPSPKQILEMIGEFEILIGRTRVPVDRELLDKAARLLLVGRAAVGTDNIDFEEARSRGIKVVNAPGAPTESVAELTLMLTLMALRDMYEGMADVKNWEFDKRKGRELGGKTVGIIGFGRIGSRYAELLKPFGVKILAHDIAKMNGDASRLGVDVVGLRELLGRSDIISLHVSMEGNNRPVLDDAAFAMTKPGALLVNTVRASAVDIKALLRSLDNKTLSFYATDVLYDENLNDREERKLIERDNVIVSPHSGANTVEAQARVAEVMIPGLIAAVKELQRPADGDYPVGFA